MQAKHFIMALRLIKIVNDSKPEGEYVMLKATEAINLAGYALADRTFSDEVISNDFRHVYFFPNMEVDKDDFIVVYTKTKAVGKGKTNNDNPCHYLSWGVDTCVWNDEGGDTVSLFQYIRVQAKNVPAVE